MKDKGYQTKGYFEGNTWEQGLAEDYNVILMLKTNNY